MSGPKRNPDKLNTIGIVVVGICSAVLVYVAIVALQAFYVNDTSEVQTMADYGGQDTTAKGHKADELRNITEAASNAASPGVAQTYRINIDHAIELVVRDSADKAAGPSHLVPALPPSTKPTIQPIFGRPKPIATPAPAPAAPAPAAAAPGQGSAAAPPAGAAAGSGGGNGH